MPDSIEQQWLARMKVTMTTELTRGMQQHLTPQALIEMLFGIPEVSEAFEMRAKGRPGS
jgi:hypothetical protein